MAMAQRKLVRKSLLSKSGLGWKIPLDLAGLLAVEYLAVSIYGAKAFNKVPTRSQFFPITPANYDLDFEEVSFPSASPTRPLTLRGWWIPNPASNRALILVHGKEESRMATLNYSCQLWQMGYNLLYFDLRGHGASDGNAYYFGQYESWDTVGAFNFVKSRGITAANIGLLGHSMGAATALLAMGRCSEIKTVFADSSFADFSKLAAELLPVEKKLPVLYLPGIFSAAKILNGFDINQTRPVKVLESLYGRHIYLTHGACDQTIPPYNMDELLEAGGDNIVGSWLAPEADHTQALDLYPDEYLAKVETFFATYLGR